MVEDASDDPERFAVGATLLLDGEQAVVEEQKRAGGRLVVRLDRLRRAAPARSPPRSLPLPETAHEYYVFQLVGLDVVEEGGRAAGVRIRAPANDVLELDWAGAPMVEDCVVEVDLDSRRILVARVSPTPTNLTPPCRSTSSPLRMRLPG